MIWKAAARMFGRHSGGRKTGSSLVTHALKPHASGSVSAKDFKSGMRSLAGAVTVLATFHEGKRYGLTATAVCSLSAEPPRLIACVNKRGVSYGAITGSRLLCVNILAHEHTAIAERFAGMANAHEDRFSDGGWLEGSVCELPVLFGAVASFECAVAEVIDANTHGIMICDILGIHAKAGTRPLLYGDGRFTTLADQVVT